MNIHLERILTTQHLLFSFSSVCTQSPTFALIAALGPHVIAGVLDLFSLKAVGKLVDSVHQLIWGVRGAPPEL